MRLQTREINIDILEGAKDAFGYSSYTTEHFNSSSEDNSSDFKENSNVSEINDNSYVDNILQAEGSEVSSVSKNVVSETTSNVENVETVVLGEGKTLRLLALELFGNREFWIYIYQENIDVISNPNRVSLGLNLKIPDADKYFIDSNNPNSVAKAKYEANKLLEKY